MTNAAVERFARLIAEASAGSLEGFELGEDTLTATPLVPGARSARRYRLIAVALEYRGAASGQSVVVLAPGTGRALATRLADGYEDAEVLAESQLAAISRAVGRLYDGASPALREALGLELAFTAGAAVTAAMPSAIPSAGADAWIISYTLEGGGAPLEIAQTVPAGLLAVLEGSLEPNPVDPAMAASAAGRDTTRLAVERASAIAADAAADVLSALFSEELSAATPIVEERPADPLAGRGYPVIAAEVSYLSGLAGTTRFILLPADAAKLAAAMMGTPETTGDGLSAIELSAVSEAMNQVMGATVAELSKTLGIDVEASPPTCVIIEDAEQARELTGGCAYRASFRLVSTVFGAEVVQLLSAELASSLDEALASLAFEQDGADPNDGFDVFADLPLAGFAAAAEPPDPRGGARELLSGIRVRVSAELGRARLPIARVANLPAGSIVVLDRAPADPVDVLVNGTPFAQAKVVLVDGEYAVQILSLSPLELTGG